MEKHKFLEVNNLPTNNIFLYMVSSYTSWGQQPEVLTYRMFCPGHPQSTDPQFLHVPSDAIHPSPSWSFSWYYHVNNCSHFVVLFILCMCLCKRCLISLTFCVLLFTPSSFLKAKLFTLSLSVALLNHLNIFICSFRETVLSSVRHFLYTEVLV